MQTFKQFNEARMYHPSNPEYKRIKKKGQAWYKAYQDELKRLAPALTKTMDWDTATYMMNQGIDAKTAAQRYVDIIKGKEVAFR